MSGVTSRSGRVIKKSTKLMDFTSPDDIEAKKAKKMAAASRKLMVLTIYLIRKCCMRMSLISRTNTIVSMLSMRAFLSRLNETTIIIQSTMRK